MTSYRLINIGAVNGLLPDGTTPIPNRRRLINSVMWQMLKISILGVGWTITNLPGPNKLTKLLYDMCGSCNLRHITILFLVKCVCERDHRKQTVSSHCPRGTPVIELYAAFLFSACLSLSSHRAALFIVMMNDYCQIKLLLPCTAPSHNRNQYCLIPSCTAWHKFPCNLNRTKINGHFEVAWC